MVKKKKKKELPANAGDARDVGSIPGSGRSPGGRNGNPLQHSCLENPMDRGAWWATVPGITESWMQLKTVLVSNMIIKCLMNFLCTGIVHKILSLKPHSSDLGRQVQIQGVKISEAEWLARDQGWKQAVQPDRVSTSHCSLLL